MQIVLRKIQKVKSLTNLKGIDLHHAENVAKAVGTLTNNKAQPNLQKPDEKHFQEENGSFSTAEDAKLPCSVCHKLYKPIFLSVHKRRFHSIVKFRKPPSKSNYRPKTKEAEEEHTFCWICREYFKRPDILNAHLLEKHNNDSVKPDIFSRDICEYSSVSKSGLMLQKRHRHTRHKIFYCSVCNMH